MKRKIYSLEAAVKKLPAAELLARYRIPKEAEEACGLCPNYGKLWSCPPGVPEAKEYLHSFREAFVIGVKVIYPGEVREGASSPRLAQAIRDISYEKVKKELLLTLLELEKEIPGGVCMGAGRCILCKRCTREEGKPCRYPSLCRYSFTAFGFDFGRLFEEVLGIRLLWSPEGLPEYDVAAAALLVP